MEWKERPMDVAVHSNADEPLGDRRRPHMWISDLDEIAVGRKVELLSLDERERANLFVDPAERHRFLASCIYLREVVAQVARASPEALRFIEGGSGRPELAPQGISPTFARALHFRLSRSDRAFALGLSLGTDVGLGLRVVRPLDLLDKMAEHGLSSEEMERLRKVPEDDFVREFSRLWTRHQAIASLDGGTLVRPVRLPARPARTTSFEFALEHLLVVGSMAVGR